MPTGTLSDPAAATALHSSRVIENRIVDPFALWLIGNAIAPDAYQRAINFVFSDDAEKRLGDHIRSEVGRFPRRAFKTWFRDGDTWRELIAGGAQFYESLVTRLVDYSSATRFSRRISREEAQKIVQVAARSLMASLDASEAVGVADHRASRRHVEAEANAESRLSQLISFLKTCFEDLERAFTQPDDFEAALLTLPALSRPPLKRLGPSRDSSYLLKLATQQDPHNALLQMATEPPQWLGEAPFTTLVAAAELCRCYGVQRGAGRFFETAAGRSDDSGYLYSRAALEYAGTGDQVSSDRCREAAQTSSAADRSVDVIAAVLSDDPERVLELLPTNDALSDPFLLGFRLHALNRLHRLDELVILLSSAVDRYPEVAGLQIELARAYLVISRETTTSGAHAFKADAFELALRARELLRRFRVNAGDAVEMACQAAIMMGQYSTAIRLGSAPPEGDATAHEADRTEVRLLVAQAAVAEGRPALARSTIPAMPASFARDVVHADLLHQQGAPMTELQAAYDRVWESASSPDQLTLYWVNAATVGVQLRGLAELALRTDDTPLLVEAQKLVAEDKHTAAIPLLRRAKQTQLSSNLLVEALINAGDIRSAAEQLRLAADRFDDHTFNLQAVRLLVNHEHFSDAADLAGEVLHGVPASSTDDRAYLHAVRVEAAGVARSWREMVTRCRAWITDLGRTSTNRWHLASALNNCGEVAKAWHVLADAPALTPTTVAQARLWTFLAARNIPGPETAAEILRLTAAYPDDTELASVAIGGFYLQGDEPWGDLPPDTIRRMQALVSQHSVEYGSGGNAPAQVVRGTPAEMFEQLRPELHARAAAIADEAENVAKHGLPYGLLAARAGTYYSQSLLARAAGCLPIAAPNDEQLEREIETATGSLNRPAVIDLSSLLLGSYIPEMWPALRSGFPRLEVTQAALNDLTSTATRLRLASLATLGYEPTTDDVRLHRPDPGEELMRDRSEWCLGEANQLAARDWPQFQALEGNPDQVHLAWLGSLDMASVRELPLYCDDLGLRVFAQGHSVPTFGTVALLIALERQALIDQPSAQRCLWALRDAYAVDLPVDTEWLRFTALSTHWAPTAVAFHFTRAAAWADNEQATQVWTELVAGAAFANPPLVAAWVEAAALGLIAAAHDPTRIHTAIAGFAATAIAFTNFDAQVLAACASTARTVAHGDGVPNPVPTLCALLHQELTKAVGTDEAARLLLSPYLDVEDQAVMRDLVLGVRSGLYSS